MPTPTKPKAPPDASPIIRHPPTPGETMRPEVELDRFAMKKKHRNPKQKDNRYA